MTTTSPTMPSIIPTTKSIHPIKLNNSYTNDDCTLNSDINMSIKSQNSVTKQSEASTDINTLKASIKAFMISEDDYGQEIEYDNKPITDTVKNINTGKSRKQNYSICNTGKSSNSFDELSTKITSNAKCVSERELGHIITKEDILLNSLITFYNNPKHFDQVLPIVHGQSNISLRILDWFITNYSKKFNVVYKINKPYKTQQFNVYIDYKSQLKAYSKRFFDPFCRRNRIPFVCNNIKIVTTIGQLNFFRWAINNNILQYVSTNLQSIELNMNEVNKNKVRQYQKKNTKKFNLPVNSSSGTNDDISISATKVVNKHNISIMVTFE